MAELQHVVPSIFKHSYYYVVVQFPQLNKSYFKALP